MLRIQHFFKKLKGVIIKTGKRKKTDSCIFEERFIGYEAFPAGYLDKNQCYKCGRRR
jgi:hypothetical protein